MIKVNVIKKDNEITKVTISGHADFNDYGQDIVCASVSSIVITSLNAVLTLKKDSVTYIEDEGFVQIIVIENNMIVKKLIDNMINLLKQLEEKYPKNIKIIK